MRPIGDLLRQSVSVGISLLMLGSSVAVPVLERGELASQTVAESQHDPGTCPTGHDHTICTQVGANASAPARTAEQRVAPTHPARWTLDTATTVRASGFPDGHPTRAPPHA